MAQPVLSVLHMKRTWNCCLAINLMKVRDGLECHGAITILGYITVSLVSERRREESSVLVLVGDTLVDSL